jgi:hypothetical protein
MRQWVDDHKKKPRDKRWVMRCDYGDGVRGAQRCTTASEPFEWQPPLELFVERGWFIAKLSGDRCPACLALGRHEGIEPSPLMTRGDTEFNGTPAKEAPNAA